MKGSITLIIFLLCQIGISQQISIRGVVFDKENNQPIYGASIIMDGNYLAFSDIQGVFSFNIEEKYSTNKVIIQHVSYEAKMTSILELKQVSTVLLIPQIFSLDEVVIDGNQRGNDAEDIIKKGTKLFDKMNIDYPYWSTMDYKQILYLDGKPHAFLQLDGHILMVGSKVNNPFIDALVVPDYIRRTKESELPIKSWSPNLNSENFSKTQLGGIETKTSWTDFRFVESVHPMSKKGQSYFNFSIISVPSEEFIQNFVFLKNNFKIHRLK